MSAERTALQSLVTAVNRYQTPHDLVQAALSGRIDGDAWHQSWGPIRSAKEEAERILAEQPVTVRPELSEADLIAEVTWMNLAADQSARNAPGYSLNITRESLLGAVRLAMDEIPLSTPSVEEDQHT